jgi:hypothetical protein
MILHLFRDPLSKKKKKKKKKTKKKKKKRRRRRKRRRKRGVREGPLFLPSVGQVEGIHSRPTQCTAMNVTMTPLPYPSSRLLLPPLHPSLLPPPP